MKVDQKIFLGYFREKNLELPCPSCSNGFLKIKEETFHSELTKMSKYLIAHGQNFCVEGKFSSLVICRNCGDVATITGRTNIVEYHRGCDIDECEIYRSENGEPETHNHSHHNILYVDPPIDIVRFSDEIPIQIKEYLRESFALFWSNEKAASNKIRVTLESFMDTIKIPKTFIDKEGEMHDSSLHRRIEYFGGIESNKYSELANRLVSVKMLGNEGSHHSAYQNITREDLFSAYKILADVFDKFFLNEKKEKSLNELSNLLSDKFKIKKTNQDEEIIPCPEL